MSTLKFRQHSSLLQHCQTPRNSLVLRTKLLTASWQRIHSRLLLPAKVDKYLGEKIFYHIKLTIPDRLSG